MLDTIDKIFKTMAVNIHKYFNELKGIHVINFYFENQLLDENTVVNTVTMFFSLIFNNYNKDVKYNTSIRIFFEDSPAIVAFNHLVELGNEVEIINDYFEYLTHFEEAYITQLEVKRIEFQSYEVTGDSNILTN
jgi:hypothetical protein